MDHNLSQIFIWRLHDVGPNRFLAKYISMAIHAELPKNKFEFRAILQYAVQLKRRRQNLFLAWFPPKSPIHTNFMLFNGFTVQIRRRFQF